MLKSFLIARMGDPAAIATANSLWRARVEKLIGADRNADGEFIKAWLRGKYADIVHAPALRTALRRPANRLMPMPRM